MIIVFLLKNSMDFIKITDDILAGSNFLEKMYRLGLLKRQFVLARSNFLGKMYRSEVETIKMYMLELTPTSFGALLTKSVHVPAGHNVAQKTNFLLP